MSRDKRCPQCREPAPKIHFGVWMFGFAMLFLTFLDALPVKQIYGCHSRLYGCYSHFLQSVQSIPQLCTGQRAQPCMEALGRGSFSCQNLELPLSKLPHLIPQGVVEHKTILQNLYHLEAKAMDFCTPHNAWHTVAV